jgi:hypothetical protein
MQATLPVPGPKDPPNIPVPRFVPSAIVPHVEQLEQLLVETIGRVQALDGPAEVVSSAVCRSSSASSERLAFGNDASIAIRHGEL